MSELSTKTKKNSRQSFKQFCSKNLIIVAFIAICLFLTIMSPRFLTVKNLLNVLIQSTTMGVVAVGMTFVIVTGGIDLSVGAVVALGAALGAGAMRSGVPFGISIILIIGIGTLFGLIQGFLISYVKMPAFIATLGGMSIGRGIMMVYLQGRTISGVPLEFQFLGNGYIFGVIPCAVVILIIVFAIGYYVLRYTAFGRAVYALGGNREATELSGINIKRIETLTYAISGMAAGLGAVVLTARLGSAVPTAGEGLEMEAISAVVIGGASLSGGRGSVMGTLVGILLLGVLNNGMNLLNIDPFYDGVVQGAVILIAVFVDTLKKGKEVC